MSPARALPTLNPVTLSPLALCRQMFILLNWVSELSQPILKKGFRFPHSTDVY